MIAPVNMRHVLIVDDEARIREVVEYALSREGFRVSGAASAKEALAAVDAAAIDLVVLDVMLPDRSGLDVCRELRSRCSTPILFLSARGDEIDRVLGLELGGDDYLVKPFSPRELVARVRAVFRRLDPSSSKPLEARAGLTHGVVAIDLERHEVRCKGRVVTLTPTELGVLAALFERPGVVLSRASLVQRAYAWDNHVTERTVDTHVRRIRAKFREEGVDPIATVHGVGYKAAELEAAG